MILTHSGRLILSATDLANFLGCRHRTALEMGAALGKRVKPHHDDPALEALFKKGLAHEAEYVESLRNDGNDIVDLTGQTDRREATAATQRAMQRGAAVIVQAALEDGEWYGRPDILLKVDAPSGLGRWSYEVADTKLATETRAGTILQLGVYCEMLAAAQGRPPEWFSVVTPGGTIRYRLDDYAAYFRLVRTDLTRAVTQDDEALAAAHYPEPVEHCDVCPWWTRCTTKRHADDHLSLVAGIGRTHRRELEARDTSTMAAFAGLPLPLPFKPDRGSVETYVRLHEQARIQVASRDRHELLHELIEPIEPGNGLCRLPEPSPGDIFFDIEGDPMADDGGREYLFGIVSIGSDGRQTYEAYWAENRAEEHAAFDRVMSRFMDTWQAHPDMHIYHYAPYEPAALKRLMGRYALHESDVDQLLRGERFVDLYAVVRRGIRAGVERYSIKDLEPCYGFARRVPLPEAGRSLKMMELALELRRTQALTPEIRQTVEGYNADDCLSTRRLRDWLETVRQEALDRGHAVPRPELKDGAASEALDEREQQTAALRARLLAGLPADRGHWTDDERARWCLAYLIDWHRREDKAVWWEYYRLRDLSEEDLLDEPLAVAGLEFVGELKKVKRSFIHRYRFPQQEIELRRNDELKTQDGTTFSRRVVSLDRLRRTIDLLVGPKKRHERATALFSHKKVDTDVIRDAIVDIVQNVAEAGSVGTALIGAAKDLLLRRPPHLKSGRFEQGPNESLLDFAVRLAGSLDDTVLAVQGPPGSGKTYTGARMIAALVQQGKRVGVTATGHKVIRNLLEAVREAAVESGAAVSLGHRLNRSTDDDGEDVEEVEEDETAIAEIKSNPKALAALTDRGVQVLGGTAWLWSRPEFAGTVDVLFVDEAGQMSLANTIGVSRAAGSLVLLGDPQQLEQPRRGTHPEGAGTSALEHMLGSEKTISKSHGLFLSETWRLAPAICSFTSELFYERKLDPTPGLENQQLRGGPIEGSGLWLLQVDHDGNRNASNEEVEAVAGLVQRLLADGSHWLDKTGRPHQLTPDDIRIVAPFNAHVGRLSDRLGPLGVPVGTVDKFQGQEAPVAIYSMATSHPEDAPRGMEFLYSLNRLNVATSRARCAAILVASPRLFEPDCSTPRQMKLANALCRYRELAQVVTDR